MHMLLQFIFYPRTHCTSIVILLQYNIITTTHRRYLLLLNRGVRAYSIRINNKIKAVVLCTKCCVPAIQLNSRYYL